MSRQGYGERTGRGLGFWWTMFVGALLAVLGLLIGAGGAWLIALGGSWYYLPAGLALLIAGGLLLKGKVAGVWLYAATWIITLIWAYWEVGMDGWGLMPRTLAPTIIMIFVLLTLPAFGDGGHRRYGNGVAAMAMAFVLLAGGGLGLSHFTTHAQSQEVAPAAPGTPGAAVTAGSGPAVTVVVQDGDTLWTIARRIQPSGDVRALVDRLAAVNGSTVVHVGDHLRVRRS